MADKNPLAAFDFIFENMLEGVILFTINGEIKYINSCGLEILGFNIEELLNKNYLSFIHPNEQNKAKANFNKILSREIPFNFKYKVLRKNGAWITVKSRSVNYYTHKSTKYLLTFFKEEPNYLKLNLKLENEKKYLQKILNAIPVAVWAKNWQGKFTIANKAYAGILNMKANDLINKSLTDLGFTEQETDKQLEQDRQIMVTAESSAQFESFFYDKSKAKVTWHLIQKLPLILEDRVEILGTSIDITENRKNRLEITEKNEELNKKNQELDRFIYSASHELRSPLTTSYGIINLMYEEESAESIREYLPLLKKSIKKMDVLVQKLVNYSVNIKQAPNVDHVDFKSLMAEIGKDLSQIKSSPKINFDCIVEQNDAFFTDRRLLSNIIRELLKNALTYNDTVKEISKVKFTAVVDKENAAIEIWDNGLGIDPNNISKVFDMYYRGNEIGDGSGLGLYMIKKYVTILKGTIKIDSAIGEGTKVKVILPTLLQSF